MRFIKSNTGYVALDYVAKFTGLKRFSHKLYASGAILKDGSIVLFDPPAIMDAVKDVIIPAAPGMVATMVIPGHKDCHEPVLLRYPIIAWRIADNASVWPVTFPESDDDNPLYVEMPDGSFDDSVDQRFETREALIATYTYREPKVA